MNQPTAISDKSYRAHLKSWLLQCCAALLLIATASAPSRASAAPTPKQNPLASAFGTENSKEPIFISANSLLLRSKERLFSYSGNVVITQGDVTITCESLDGSYSETNKIEKLNAKKNVRLKKGTSMNGRSNLAEYQAATRVLVLKENPELEQNGSTLAADIIKVFLDENRSVAEGQVRVKMLPSATGKS